MAVLLLNKGYPPFSKFEAVQSRRKSRSTYIRPLIAFALCSCSGLRGWTGVVCSGGQRGVNPGYTPGSRLCRHERIRVQVIMSHWFLSISVTFSILRCWICNNSTWSNHTNTCDASRGQQELQTCALTAAVCEHRSSKLTLLLCFIANRVY